MARPTRRSPLGTSGPLTCYGHRSHRGRHALRPREARCLPGRPRLPGPGGRDRSGDALGAVPPSPTSCPEPRPRSSPTSPRVQASSPSLTSVGRPRSSRSLGDRSIGNGNGNGNGSGWKPLHARRGPSVARGDPRRRRSRGVRDRGSRGDGGRRGHRDLPRHRGRGPGAARSPARGPGRHPQPPVGRPPARASRTSSSRTCTARTGSGW